MSAQRFYGGSLEPLGEFEVGVIASASSPTPARDGHILVPAGIDLTNYRRNPIVLWQHMPTSPVATATAIGIDSGGNLAARITFPQAGISQTADEVRALVKSGIVKGVSIGFDPVEVEPLDPKAPRGGMRILRSELLECSFVSIPADVGAGVVARSFATRTAMLAAINALPSVPHAAIARAAALLPQRSPGRLLSHAGQVWALQQAEREREKQWTKEARRAELRRLEEVGKDHLLHLGGYGTRQ